MPSRWPEVENLIPVNVLAAFATVDALLPAMRARSRGQVVLISSLAGYFGLPITPSYSASKAALKAYGEAMRGLLAGSRGRRDRRDAGLRRDADGARISRAQAVCLVRRARRAVIRRRLERNPARISFPFPLDFGSWITAVLPAALSQRLIALIGYGR